MNTHLVLRIFMPGGVIAHNDLESIVELSKTYKIANIQFGLRQDVNLMVDRSQKEEISAHLEMLNFDYEFNTDWSRNIVTSFVSNGVFQSESWLTEGTYLDILDSFEFKPKLRVNIVDPNQGLVSVFTGNLNFIASKSNNYWYLKMDLPNWFDEMTFWPSLVYSYDIDKVAQKIEELYDSNEKLTINELFEKINEVLNSNSRRIDQELNLPAVPLPYYEGVNKSGNKYWLGVYKRNYLFDIDFLEAILGLLAKEKDINNICVTPWRSILIKGIRETQWKYWLKVLGKYGVNIRHSALELNWRVPDFDRSAIELKQYLVNEFDKNDIRTFGLTFAVRTKKVDLDAMIVIERIHTRSFFKDNKLASSFNILHTKGFEENQKEYVEYATGVNYKSLPKVLQKLTNLFYEEQITSGEETVSSSKKKKPHHVIYQCKHCFTTYDQEYGDDINYIAAGTAFKDISDTFKCPVCDAAKSDFTALTSENSAA